MPPKRRRRSGTALPSPKRRGASGWRTGRPGNVAASSSLSRRSSARSEGPPRGPSVMRRSSASWSALRLPSAPTPHRQHPRPSRESHNSSPTRKCRRAGARLPENLGRSSSLPSASRSGRSDAPQEHRRTPRHEALPDPEAQGGARQARLAVKARLGDLEIGDDDLTKQRGQELCQRFKAAGTWAFSEDGTGAAVVRLPAG